ncbi:hypothetical protein BO83DRAFT_427933 [Aspergillus eucalypticola CBS 122712]|uniref:Uncharacterized protein n=1 Tax=Aspergillus eucalypticola (strain CBS 122712 / IBT 29274) TaxID=1448314 RepID=A0A317VE65_ASPEC|nr:uncharacterized protein BO83DRAFT_427933 [Aspergillus eucalypticola CBS 122712]PWY71327.1 hypothetical protein BO83DRAFT_427933 [Aspergillus eucalypticola CBS 122712]
MEELAAADGWFGMDDFSEVVNNEVVNNEVSTVDAGTEADDNYITGVEVEIDEGAVVPREVTRLLGIAGIELDTATGDVETDTMVDVCVERPVDIEVSVSVQGLVVKRIAAL